jgi:peptide/histidine transporter 3/4
MFSTFIEQGMVMEKHLGSFEIPAASFQSVAVIAVLLLILLGLSMSQSPEK